MRKVEKKGLSARRAQLTRRSKDDADGRQASGCLNSADVGEKRRARLKGFCLGCGHANKKSNHQTPARNFYLLPGF
jgi:hypothetical protein